MSHDILQPIPQGGYGAYDEENRKIQGITDELKRLCRVHEEEFGDSQTNGGSLEIEQRITEQYAKTHNLWIPIDYMFDLGVIVWDVVPRNVLVDDDEDLYVVDAEIKSIDDYAG